MIKKQVASLLFNKNRVDDDLMATEELSDSIHSSTEIDIQTQDLTDQITSKAFSFPLPSGIQKIILSAKEVLAKNRELFSKLK